MCENLFNQPSITILAKWPIFIACAGLQALVQCLFSFLKHQYNFIIKKARAIFNIINAGCQGPLVAILVMPLALVKL